MNKNIIQSNKWLWFTAPNAMLQAIYQWTVPRCPYLVVQAEAQDLISLAIVLPTLIITALLASRGSPYTYLFWLGTLVYLAYSYE